MAKVWRRHMRLIGHLASESAANTFADFLSSQGIGNETEAAQEGWEVWVHSEDQWERAKVLLGEFIANPAAPQYTVRVAEAAASPLPRITVEWRRRRDEGGAVLAEAPARTPAAGLLTLVFVGLCLTVQVLREVGFEDGVLRELFMTATTFDGTYFRWQPGLSEIGQGEFWRLFTPVMVHGDWLHLLMNMLLLLHLGSRIESCQGTGRLGWLVLVTAVLSNFGQYALYDANFCGMSGVLYGLLGYACVKGRLDPASGLSVPRNTAIVMVVWFFLCLAGLVPRVANGAHAVGLVTGAALGVLLSLGVLRRRTSA